MFIKLLFPPERGFYASHLEAEGAAPPVRRGPVPQGAPKKANWSAFAGPIRPLSEAKFLETLISWFRLGGQAEDTELLHFLCAMLPTRHSLANLSSPQVALALVQNGTPGSLSIDLRWHAECSAGPMGEQHPPLEIEADFEEVANPGRRAGDRAPGQMKFDLLFATTLIANLFAPPARDGAYLQTGVRRGARVNFRT